jgi:hypothetical protein
VITIIVANGIRTNSSITIEFPRSPPITRVRNLSKDKVESQISPIRRSEY